VLSVHHGLAVNRDTIFEFFHPFLITRMTHAGDHNPETLPCLFNPHQVTGPCTPNVCHPSVGIINDSPYLLNEPFRPSVFIGAAFIVAEDAGG
jgi:hypothetical protein